MRFENDTLGISVEAQRRHEIDLMTLLSVRRRPVPLELVIGSPLPRWAVEAAERLLVSGELVGAIGEKVAVPDAVRDTIPGRV